MILAFMSCDSDNAPGHHEALSQIRELISNENAYTVTKLSYVNGFQKDTSNYVVSTTFTRKFKVSSKELANEVGFLMAIKVWAIYGSFEPGDSFDEAQDFLFLRTEKGWILQGFDGGESSVQSKHIQSAQN